MGGRAAWPTVRLLADKMRDSFDKDVRGVVLIKFTQDVRQSSVELCPEDSELFCFLKILRKKLNFPRAQN